MKEAEENVCVWCNERPTAYPDSSGCSECPTIPYKCTCDAGDKPHDIACERSPRFEGKHKIDPEREALYKLEFEYGINLYDSRYG